MFYVSWVIGNVASLLSCFVYFFEKVEAKWYPWIVNDLVFMSGVPEKKVLINFSVLIILLCYVLVLIIWVPVFWRILWTFSICRFSSFFYFLKVFLHYSLDIFILFCLLFLYGIISSTSLFSYPSLSCFHFSSQFHLIYFQSDLFSPELIKI